MKGILITLEGTEGSGKSVQSALLCKYLKKSGYSVFHTREPGNTQVGKNIRKLLLDPKNKGIYDITELFLYLADRHQHVKEIIQPKIKGGYIVVCDRYTDATVAYQGYGRKLLLPFVHELNKFATQGLKPDLTVVLDIPLELGLRRAVKVGPYQGDRIEKEKLDFHKRVRAGYLKSAKQDPKRIKLIDADRGIADIQKDIRMLTEKLLKTKILIYQSSKVNQRLLCHLMK